MEGEEEEEKKRIENEEGKSVFLSLSLQLILSLEASFSLSFSPSPSPSLTSMTSSRLPFSFRCCLSHEFKTEELNDSTRNGGGHGVEGKEREQHEIPS